ncbi:MAG: hypothetical protein H0T18_07235 [Chloroflexia bacterium]|nr:hypothetical protein [Chloroflexia bacterium]
MPTYSYLCDSCGHSFETVQRFADEALTECPQCGSLIRRVIQPVGVVFKGSGWYINDSRPKAASESSDSTAKTASAADKTAKSDSSEKGSPAKTDSPSKNEAKSEKSTVKVAD